MPQAWGPTKGSQALLLVGGPLGLIGGLWGAWTLLPRSSGILAPEAGRRKQTGFLWSPRHRPSLS